MDNIANIITKEQQLNNSYSSAISMDAFELMVNIGYSESERKTPQRVMFYTKFFFRQPPKAFYNDSLDDTICYQSVADVITRTCDGSEFKLLEFLCHEIFSNLRANVPSNVKIWLKVEKCKPPVENLKGSASFEFTDAL